METYVIWVSLLLFEIVYGDNFLRPTSKCVPTDTIQGHCHVCVCHTDGIYHCRDDLCEETARELDPSLKECEPDQLYRQNNNFCSCSATGYWLSANCRKRFQRLVVKKDPIKKYLRTNIDCKPNSLYITDCNVCQCKASGVIDFNSCTTRPCPKRLKVDSCKPGDVYRSVDEFCMCSIVNYFVDRLCVKVAKDAIQPISDKKLARVIDADGTYLLIGDVCEGNATYTKDCNTCVCSESRYYCTISSCSDDKPALRSVAKSQKKLAIQELKSETQKCVPGRRYKFKSNVTLSRNNELPEIKEGEACEPGKSYKMSCNRCFCNSDKRLFCTKMACVDWRNFIHDGDEKVDPKAAIRSKKYSKQVLNAARNNKNRIKKTNKIGEVTILRNNLIQDIDDDEADETVNEPEEPKESEQHHQKTVVRSPLSKLPDLPQGKCVPGRIYKSGCRRCFCNFKSQATCSENLKGACTMYDGRLAPVRQPEDVRPAFTREELKNLPSLPSGSAKCQPGKTFIVDCNTCICTEKMNLICTKVLCLSFEDINRIEADERSGNKCTDDKVTNEHCIECRCIKGITSCKQIPMCITETRTRLSKGSDVPIKMRIDPIKDECVPDGVYTDDCNRCYCQPDKTLRCTQKTCLNFAQAKALNAEYRRLERAGL